MRVSLSYLTSTSSVSGLRSGAEPDLGGPHCLDPIGYHPGTGAIYLLEHFEDETGDLPQLYVMHTRGSHVGRAVPVRSWYQGPEDQVEERFEERLAALRGDLIDLEPMPDSALSLDTRVVRRRALRLFADEPPIRKYELRLSVRPAGGGRRARTMSSLGASTVVTAFLRPNTRLIGAYAVPGEALAVAIVEYVGIPFELGYSKNAALLVPFV